MYPFSLGIDLHLKRTYAVLMDPMGRTLDERRLPNDEMQGYLNEMVPHNTYAILEATRVLLQTEMEIWPTRGSIQKWRPKP